MYERFRGFLRPLFKGALSRRRHLRDLCKKTAYCAVAIGCLKSIDYCSFAAESAVVVSPSAASTGAMYLLLT